jgi:dUTP pyrophosphatase
MKMKTRGFEIISEYIDKDINLPIRKTKYSAGYDVEAAKDVVIPPFTLGTKPVLVPTGLKAYCPNDEFYMLVNRSSNPLKRGLVLANGIGIIDADYYNNPDNEGHIQLMFYNYSDKEYIIKKHENIGQVIFSKYLTVDNDKAEGIRTGGFGSTSK